MFISNSHLFLFIIYIVFPFPVYSLSNSTPRSPPQSPDWDALLSVPIHQSLFGNFLSSPAEASSNNQAMDKARSRTKIGTTDHFNMQNREMMVKHKIANEVNKPKQSKKLKYVNLPEEERQERLLEQRKKQAEYQRQRRKELKKPENAEKLKEMNKKNSKRNLIYRHNLIVEVHSGNASQERVETYLRRKEADRRRQHRKYVKLQAKRS